jgi:hypothetical protein
MEKTLTQKRIEFLQEGFDYYWNKPERRCMSTDSDGMLKCQYIPTETSEGCFIGRRLDRELAESLPNYAVNEDSFPFEKLPDWMKELGQNFLSYPQKFHDKKYLFDKNSDFINSLLNEDYFIQFDIIEDKPVFTEIYG